MGANAALFHQLDSKDSNYLPSVKGCLETQPLFMLDLYFSKGSDFTGEIFCPAESGG